MNILVLGASGYIGAWVTTGLINAGHKVTCCVRNVEQAKLRFPNTKIIYCHFNKTPSISDWQDRLQNIDVIINCVGIFYHTNKDIIWGVHFDTPRIIYEAAAKMKVKKIIHISALNVEKYDTEYAKSKRALEKFLKTQTVPSIILKPSLVYGPGSYGGMSLFRGLASLPYFIFVPSTGNQKVQPIHVEDLVRAIKNYLDPLDDRSAVFAAVSPQPITIKNLLMTLREWLGFSKAKIIPMPVFFIRLLNLINNFIPHSILNKDALAMLATNNIATEKEALDFQHSIKFIPKDFVSGIYSQPSEEQDKWHAKLVVFKPLLRLSLVVIWLVSAITSAFIYPKYLSLQMLAQVGIPSFWQPIFLYTACVINFLIALALLFDYKTRINYALQIVIILIYTLIITIKLPHLWTEPFGPIVKNIPLLILISFLFSIEKKRS